MCNLSDTEEMVWFVWALRRPIKSVVRYKRFFSAASQECHSASAAVVLSKSDATQPRYNPDKPPTERTFCGIAHW